VVLGVEPRSRCDSTGSTCAPPSLAARSSSAADAEYHRHAVVLDQQLRKFTRPSSRRRSDGRGPPTFSVVEVRARRRTRRCSRFSSRASRKAGRAARAASFPACPARCRPRTSSARIPSRDSPSVLRPRSRTGVEVESRRFRDQALLIGVRRYSCSRPSRGEDFGGSTTSLRSSSRRALVAVLGCLRAHRTLGEPRR